MQVGPFRELRPDLAGWKALVRDNDTLADVIIANERWIGTGIDAIPREHLGADRFHPFYVIGIQHRYFAAASDTNLSGVGGKVFL